MKFQVGSVVATPPAIQFCGLNHIDIYTLLLRHANGDWGDVCREDAEANEGALRSGARILSVYKFPAGTVWILTTAADDDYKRESTCVMLPSDY
jgi:hypothetical protein